MWGFGPKPMPADPTQALEQASRPLVHVVARIPPASRLGAREARSRPGGPPLLVVPARDDPGGRAAVLLGQPHDDGVAQQGAVAAERAPRLGDDAVGPVYARRPGRGSVKRSPGAGRRSRRAPARPRLRSRICSEVSISRYLDGSP
jgi:hypothetical protein